MSRARPPNIAAALLIAAAMLATWSKVCIGAARGDVLVDGIQMHYTAVGQGAPLVLLHHFGWSGKVWEPFIATFAKQHRVIVVDLPGHGGSTGWTEPLYDYPRNARRVLHLLEAIGVQRFDAIGASSGSITLLEMAIEKPGRIGRMIVVGSTTSIPDATREWIRANACGPVSEQDLREGLLHQSHGQEQVIGLAKMFCNEKDQTLEITPQQLASITAETLVVHGDHDRIFPVSGAMSEYLAIPHAYLWTQPNASHVFIFKPEYQQVFLNTALVFLHGSWK